MPKEESLDDAAFLPLGDAHFVRNFLLCSGPRAVLVLDQPLCALLFRCNLLAPPGKKAAFTWAASRPWEARHKGIYAMQPQW